jgi:von Willebrand factor type A domain
MLVALTALLMLQAGPATSPALETHTVTVTLTDASGRGVTDLGSDELALVENGVVRDLVKITPDARPLVVAILVDSSQELSSTYRLYLVDAVAALVKALPEGARYAIWVTGERPRKLVDVTDDRAAVAALKRVAPQGGNTLLDGLVEVTKELRKREGDRLAVVAVSGYTTEFSSRDRYRVAEEARRNADLFLFFSFDEGLASFENRTSYDYVMQELIKDPGGRLERAITAMAATKTLPGLARDLQPGLRLTYESVAGLKQRNIEVQVSRPGLQVRVGPAR